MTTSESTNQQDPSRWQARKAKKNATTTYESKVTVSRVAPWSVMKLTFIYSFVLSVAVLIAVYFSWTLLEASGIIEKTNEITTSLTANETDTGVVVEDYINSSVILRYGIILSITIWTVSTVLATLLAVIYNLTNKLVGGIEITLSQPITGLDQTSGKSNYKPANSTRKSTESLKSKIATTSEMGSKAKNHPTNTRSEAIDQAKTQPQDSIQKLKNTTKENGAPKAKIKGGKPSAPSNRINRPAWDRDGDA